MNDMLGNQLKIGDTVIWPDGNARYGGLYLRAGTVVKLTETRATVNSFKFPTMDKEKTTSKTGPKLLVTDDKAIKNKLTEIANDT